MLASFESGDDGALVLELEQTARAGTRTCQVNVCEYESVAMRAVCPCACERAVSRSRSLLTSSRGGDPQTSFLLADGTASLAERNSQTTT